MRKAFEKWATRCGYFVPVATFRQVKVGNIERYGRDDIEAAWLAWQAGRVQGVVEGQNIGFEEGWYARDAEISQ